MLATHSLLPDRPASPPGRPGSPSSLRLTCPPTHAFLPTPDHTAPLLPRALNPPARGTAHAPGPEFQPSAVRPQPLRAVPHTGCPGTPHRWLWGPLCLESLPCHLLHPTRLCPIFQGQFRCRLLRADCSDATTPRDRPASPGPDQVSPGAVTPALLLLVPSKSPPALLPPSLVPKQDLPSFHPLLCFMTVVFPVGTTCPQP